MVIHISLVHNFKSLANDELGGLGLGDGIDVLNLNQSLHIVFQHFLEEVLKFTTSEELQNFLPLWWRLELAEIGFHVSREHPQGSGFSNTVGSDQSEDLAGPGGWKPMQLETVCSVSVGDLILEALG